MKNLCRKIEPISPAKKEARCFPRRPLIAAGPRIAAGTSLPKIIIILLNWNNCRDAAEYLKSLSQFRYSNFKILLVESGSKDGSATALKRDFPRHTLRCSQVNLGYYEGNNRKIEYP
jgi:hypothetical protein